ncbi:hypothetical protein IEQ34_018605 [Dendrobium chrysotoxum]|uniref:Uncharacterized protein n=1 Tax=Dendrobium chrysotoxum TaxID=161865 RepID=A0AAV7G4I7_DENCH|nr:hypothetical protein IEQ34_018605 [Dendrobium chrysotoxum]
MHGHGLNECYRLHPHLRKEKESSKQLSRKDDPLVNHDIVIPNLDVIEGNNPKILDNVEESIQLAIAHTELHSTNIDEPLLGQGEHLNTISCLAHGSQNVYDKMLTITTNLNIIPSSAITPCALNKNLPDMDFVLLNNSCTNNVPSQSIVNDQEDGHSTWWWQGREAFISLTFTFPGVGEYQMLCPPPGDGSGPSPFSPSWRRQSTLRMLTLKPLFLKNLSEIHQGHRMTKHAASSEQSCDTLTLLLPHAQAQLILPLTNLGSLQKLPSRVPSSVNHDLNNY